MNQVFKFNNSEISVLGTKETPMFFGSQIAKALGYINTRDAIIHHVWEKNKTSISEYKKNIKGSDSRPLDHLHPQTVLISEPGIYQLIFASKLEKAKKFQDFVFSEVLPTIRKKGSYQLPKLINNQFVILNEQNLHEKVVNYLRKYYEDALFNSTLGELQDTSEKRINAYELGYCPGIPDLIIYEHSKDYNGLTIEFKTPKGTNYPTEKQISVNNKLSDRGFKTIISDDYDDIIIKINDYLSYRRYKCNKCRLKFHTTTTLKTHLKIIHRIKHQ